MLNIHRGRDRMGPPLLFQWTAKDLLPKSPVPSLLTAERTCRLRVWNLKKRWHTKKSLLGALTMPDVMASNLVYSSMESVSGGATTSLWKI